MINDNKEKSFDIEENNENKIIEIKYDDSENDEKKLNNIKNNMDENYENKINENKIINLENNDDNIGENNNISNAKNNDIQNKIIVENTESQDNDIKIDNEKNKNIINIIKKENFEDNENLCNDIKNDVVENDENKINIIKNDDYITTHENKEELKKEMEISEKELNIIKIINKLKEKEFKLFFRYLHDIKIPIFKVIANGFIEFIFNDENKEKNILNIISRVTSLCFNKNMFYFIYNKLSEYYRKNYKIDSIDSIKKFEKIFKVWKLLYNPLNIKSFYENNNSFILFFSKSKKENNNITINYDTKKRYHFGIKIKFLPFPILEFNKYNNDFFFIKFHDKNKTFVVKYNDIISNENNCLSNIDEIVFTIQQHSINAQLKPSDEVINLKNENKFSFVSVSKIEILGNFTGYISSISIYNNNIDIDELGYSKKYKIKIRKDTHNKIQYTIFMNDEQKEQNYQIEGINLEQIFSKELIDLNNNNKDIIERTRCLGKIKFYGGFESFIPIFKILKYIINNLYNMISNKNENESILNFYINESIAWIKDILKIMLNMICLSEKNYQNFKNIIIPLLGSLSEIYHIFNSFKELSSKNYIYSLFNDEIFFILYIIILNQNIPVKIKDAFGFIFGITENFNNFNFTMEPIIFDIKENKIYDLEWYFFIIIYFIEFFLLYFDSKEKIPQNLIKQLDLILNEELNLSNEKLSDNTGFLNVMKYLNNFAKEFISNNNFENNVEEILEKEKLFKYVINFINIFLNVEIIKEKTQKKESLIFSDKFRNFLLDIHNKINKKKINSSDFQKRNIKKILIKNFKYYKSKMKFLNNLYPFLEEKDFISENKFLLEELVDYNRKYHHLMKELFIFNRFWSDQNLFFANTSDAMKNSKLKYKNINYYTRNFQKPIIYPYLDYKNHYPEFSKFKINKDLYKAESENTDDYNFDLDCPELDKFIQDCYNETIKEFKAKEDIKLENACFIKQQYHVKGDFFLSKNSENSFSIYFYSYPFEKQNNYKIQSNCNKKNIKESKAFNESNSNLCYGSIFKCPKKECNRKIFIDSEDIRLIMKRIYFYRKSSIEIFTNTKAYYFNFVDEGTMNNIFDFIKQICSNIYLPIKYRKEINGLLKVNPSILSNIEQKEKDNFIDFIKGHTSKGQFFEMSTFDLIMLINLISNRSFNDLHQYPVFPLLYFCNKSNKNFLERDLKEHIGFQEVTEEAKKRKKLLKEIYKGSKADYDEDDKTIPYFFSTHYSNIVYTSNYLIRLFPFSSLSIELQGDGFDNSNRLFFSIQETFFNISTQKSDLRELIPEFFYFPEMFINLNCFNFGKRSNNNPVDDVIIPEIFPEKNIIELVFDKKRCKRIETTNNFNNNDDEKYFLFVEDMKKRLENSRTSINSWLDLIFGLHQKYYSKGKQYFRDESYIDIDQKKQEEYINDDDTMKSVEFGLIPLQTIFEKNPLKDKNSYEYLESKKERRSINSEKESNKRDSVNSRKDECYKKYEIDNYFENKNNGYWDDGLDLDFKTNEENGNGELGIYKNGHLIDELMDHNDEISHIFYNKRLNMFAVTSKDGFIYVYIIPNKLFSVIKHPDNRYFKKVYLSSNPFPTIVAYDEGNKSLTSYSLSGIMIKKVKIKENGDIYISPLFNIYGGTFKDELKIYSENQKKYIFCNIPFFD